MEESPGSPYDAGRWVVLDGFSDESDLSDLNGTLARIVDDDDVDDRYLVEIPATDDTEHIRQREPFVADKSNLLPALTALTTSAMQVSSFRDESGDMIPCYQHWTQKEQDQLETHIATIEQYVETNKANKSVPQIPEWYLYSLRASLRKWGTIPADFGETPPMKNAHERCVHIEPRGCTSSNNRNDGENSPRASDDEISLGVLAMATFLEVTILLRNRMWNDRDRALEECITIVKNTVLASDERATLVYFKALRGGYPEPACEDTTAVFAVTKDLPSSPLTVVKPVGCPPQVNLRLY